MWFKLSKLQLNQPITASSFLTNFSLGKHKQKEIFSSQHMKINNQVASFDTIISSQDNIEIYFDEHNETKPGLHAPQIIYSDDFVLAVNKDAKKIIYDLDNPNNETVDMQVSRYFMNQDRDALVRHLHRLDTDTTGVLLYAMNPLAHSYFSAIWQDQVQKEYIAIVEGSLKNKQGKISLNIGANRHRNNHYVTTKSGKPAITHYQVLKEGNGVSLVKIKLETGRTHQIRVHFLAIGHPLVGDQLYESNIQEKRVLLHSSTITYPDPITGKQIEIHSDIPEDMKAFLRKRGLI
ncbi:MAG: RluA family pseudouridine synthase [Candidatus Izemoplasmatales bacterium]